MIKCKFSPSEKDLDFAIKIAESKLERENRRISSLTNKINFYFIFLTISLSLVIFLINLLSDKTFFFSELKNGNFLKYFKVFFISIVFIFSIPLFIYLFKIIKNLLDALKPISLMQHDNESIELSIKKGSKKAKEIYLSDLLKSDENNSKKIDKQFTLLNYVNFYFKRFTYLLFSIIVLLSFALIAISFSKNMLQLTHNKQKVKQIESSSTPRLQKIQSFPILNLP